MTDDPKKTPDEAENTEDTIRVPEGETASHTDAKRSVQDVRQGHTGDHLRYILAASLGGAILLIAILVAYFAV